MGYSNDLVYHEKNGDRSLLTSTNMGVRLLENTEN
jgi:hypothetical protein